MKKLSEFTEPELKEYMNLLAGLTESVLPPGSCFALLVFEDTPIAQYVSNAPRSEMVKAMRACADRVESREDVRR